MDKEAYCAAQVKKLVADGMSQAEAEAKAADMWEKRGDNADDSEPDSDADDMAKEVGTKRDIPQSERDKLPDSDFAGEGDSFPIQKPADVSAAAHSLGRTNQDRDKVKARIIAIAYRKGAAFVAELPDDWKRGGDTEKGKRMPPDERPEPYPNWEHYAKEEPLLERLWARISERLGRKEDADTSDGTGFKVMGNYFVATWSNNFKDRDGEIFTAKAIDAYVARVDSGIVAPPDLAIWHLGKKSYIGRADWVAHVGHFLIAAGKFNANAPEKVKAYYQKHAKETALSHGFTYPSKEFDGKFFHAFNSFEISLLPRGAEANSYTSLEGVKAMALDERKKKYLKEIGYSDADITQMETDIDQRGKDLEAINTEFKDFADPTGLTPAASSTSDKALKELVPDLIGADAENASATLALAGIVRQQQKAIAELTEYVKQQKALTPKRASTSPLTELDAEDEKDAGIIQQIQRENADAKAAKAFPGLYDHEHSIDKMARAQFNAQNGG